jgi:hypothetical protein
MISKTITSFVSLIIFTSCATYSVVSTNAIEETVILIQGEREALMGLRVEAGGFVINNVESSDIYKNKNQTSNQINSSRRTLSIKVPVNQGTTELKIFKNGQIIFKKNLYLGAGQTRKIQI